MARKVAITGTSKGLGRALSAQFLQMGHQVFGGARTPGEQLGFEPAGAYHQVDVTDSASLDRWWTSARERFGGLPDLVIANAAVINRSAPLWRVPEAEFRQVVEANVVGVYLTFKQFISLWEESAKKPAVLVALSSGWGRSTSPEVAPYCASKWAVERMVGALAQELPELTVVALNPGIIDTEMLRSCFGEGAGHYNKPGSWARPAARQILAFDRSHNGKSATINENERASL